MKRFLCIATLLASACADATMFASDTGVPPDSGAWPGADADFVPPPDVAATMPDASIQDGGSPVPPPPPPTALEPCANGDCWESALGGPPCSTDTHDEDFSSGTYNVHAYATMAWDGTPTRIRVTPNSGTWEPVVGLRSADGTTLFDGERGLQLAGLVVEAASATDVTVTSDVPLPIVVFVTSRASLDSEFVERVPTNVTYTVGVESNCGTRLGCTVNGNAVRDPACGWLHYVGYRVVPILPGTRDERLDTAAVVAWWALKEGVLFLPNPIVYSNCNFPDGDARIGPLDSCAANRAWQVGLSGVQVPWHTDAEVEAVVAAIHPDRAIADVLRITAIEAQLAPDEVDAVVSSTGTLRRSWLLRNSAVGFAVEAPVVRGECVDDSLRWCYGTGWDTTQLYAPDRAAALRAMDDVKALLDQLAP